MQQILSLSLYGNYRFFCTDMATKVVLCSPCLHSIHIRLCSHFTRLLFKTKSPVSYSTAMNTYLICDSSLYSQIDECATQFRSVTEITVPVCAEVLTGVHGFRPGANA